MFTKLAKFEFKNRTFLHEKLSQSVLKPLIVIFRGFEHKQMLLRKKLLKYVTQTKRFILFVLGYQYFRLSSTKAKVLKYLSETRGDRALDCGGSVLGSNPPIVQQW